MTVLHAFNHEHNALEVARQEYELAKDHYRQVLKYRISWKPEHEQRFKDAHERLEEAREQYLRVLDEHE